MTIGGFLNGLRATSRRDCFQAEVTGASQTSINLHPPDVFAARISKHRSPRRQQLLPVDLYIFFSHKIELLYFIAVGCRIQCHFLNCTKRVTNIAHCRLICKSVLKDKPRATRNKSIKILHFVLTVGKLTEKNFCTVTE